MADYSYQVQLEGRINELLKTPFAKVVLAAAPASGKTRMAIRCIRSYLEQNPESRVLILAHAQTLIRNQWASVMGSEGTKLEHLTITPKLLAKRPRYNWHTKDRAQKRADDKTRKAWDDEAAKYRVYLAIPQSLSDLEDWTIFENIDLIVVDEAHQWYFSPSEQAIIEKYQPRHQLLLTGSPSLFIGKPEFHIEGVSLLELFEKKVVTDPIIELAEGFERYDFLSYNQISMTLKRAADSSHVRETLESVLKSVLVRTKMNSRDQTYNFQADDMARSWDAALVQLKKTMIMCRDQDYAMVVHSIFAEWGIKAELSISELGSGQEELDRFKTADDTKLFIVVKRGTLGFDFPALMNVIDLSFSLNVNGLFQAICRIVRQHPDDPAAQKIFIKVTNKEMAPLTYYIMSFVVALAHPKYYWEYSGDYRNLKIAIAPKLFQVAKLWDRSKFPDLPPLMTFTDILKNPDALVNSVACTTFAEVQRRIYAAGEDKSVADALQKADGYYSLFDFAQEHPEDLDIIKKEIKTHLLHRKLNENFIELQMEESEKRRKEFLKYQFVKKYKSERDFFKNNPDLEGDGSEKIYVKSIFSRRSSWDFMDEETERAASIVAYDREVRIDEDGAAYTKLHVPWQKGPIDIFATIVETSSYSGASVKLIYCGQKIPVDLVLKIRAAMKSEYVNSSEAAEEHT